MIPPDDLWSPDDFDWDSKYHTDDEIAEAKRRYVVEVAAAINAYNESTRSYRDLGWG